MPEAPDAWTDVTELLELSRPMTPLRVKRRRDWRTLRRVLLLAVLPTALAAGYFWFVAADRYVTEARFVIHEPNAAGRMSLPSASVSELPKNSGDEDSYAVHDFVLSRDAMRLVEQSVGLPALLRPAASDPAWRFPGPLNGGTEEDLFQYYRRLVSLDYDSGTNVSTLTVQAFRPADAQRIATALLGGAEALLNRMDERARTDAIRVAEAEVAGSRTAALAAQDALTAYRNGEHVIDPLQFSQTVLSTITTLSEELVNAAAELDVAVHASPNGPQIPPLRGRIAALGAQIDRERGVLAGSDGSLAPQIAAYERLVLLRSFAEQRYVSALTLLQMTRLDGERQTAYLEQVVTPYLADQPHYPFRLLWPAVTLGAGLLLCWLFRPASPLPPRRLHGA